MLKLYNLYSSFDDLYYLFCFCYLYFCISALSMSFLIRVEQVYIFLPYYFDYKFILILHLRASIVMFNFSSTILLGSTSYCYKKFCFKQISFTYHDRGKSLFCIISFINFILQAMYNLRIFPIKFYQYHNQIFIVGSLFPVILFVILSINSLLIIYLYILFFNIFNNVDK